MTSRTTSTRRLLQRGSQPFNLKGMKPVALITGGTRGIGLALARLLKDDYNLVILGRDPQRLDEVSEELGARGVQVDLADVDSIEGAFDGVDLPRVDVLVHSAGILRTGVLAETTNADFTESFAVNVIAVAALTRVLQPALETARGRVVMINSGSGKRGSATSAVYSSTKFALNGLADCLRQDLGPKGIRVTTIAPGRTDTDMQRELVASEEGTYTPQAYLTPEEVAHAVVHAIKQSADIEYISVRPPMVR